MEMWFSEFHTPDVKHSIQVNKHLYSRQSDLELSRKVQSKNSQILSSR